MKIQILGTRGKIKPTAPRHELHTGILINDELLVDVGEGDYLEKDPAAILFTHFHPDHAFFVPAKELFTPEIPHFGPEPHANAPNLKVLSEDFEFNQYKISPFPVIHALSLTSLGYVIEKAGKKVLITGDVAWIEKSVVKKLPRVDLIITEASFLRKGGRIHRKGDKIFGHTGIPDLLRLLRPLSSRFAFLHYGSWFYDDIGGNTDRIAHLDEALETIPTFDGMELTI